MKNKSGKIAVFQISLLLISMFAFAFLIGGMSKVGAVDDTPESCTYTENNKIYSGFCLENRNDCTYDLGFKDVTKTNPAVSGCSEEKLIGCCYDPSKFKEEESQITSGCTDINTGITGTCTFGAQCAGTKGFDSQCATTQVCCYQKFSADDGSDFDWQSTLSTGLGLYSQANQLKTIGKNVLGDEDEISSLQNPTSTSGSSLGSVSSAGGIVGTGLGYLGISTYAKGTEYVVLGGKEVLVTDLTLEQLSSDVIVGGIQTYSGIGYSLAGIIKGATWGYLVNLGITWLGGLIDPDNADLWEDIGTSVGWGIFAGQAAFSLLSEGGMLSGMGAAIGFGPWGAIAVGAATAIIIFLSIYDETRTEVVTFTCYPWAAELGGENCETCNEQGDIPCTEYQCKSLGQACELINKDETGEPICYWKNPKDVTPPIMTPLESALLADFAYTPDNTISPPDRGVRVVYDNNQDGCLPAFTPISFGVNTSEPSRCKIDVRRTSDFDSMMSYVGEDSSFAFEHTQAIVLPGPDASGNLTLANGGENSLYIRCQDPNGNFDLANFVFNYCVYGGPDTTPPLIVTTSLLNGGPIAFNQSSVDLTVYVNEPSDCKWDYLDKSYGDMDNEMICVDDSTQFNAQMLYECDTTLSGLISNKENKFYFRCKDQPQPGVDESDRNENMESYVFKLQGTLPLQIDSVLPDETIDGPTDKIKVTLEVETSAGYKEGISICGYKDQDETAYTDFFNTNSYYHTQDLWLDEGDYNYSIMCVDLGGNTDYANAVFSVETDTEWPIIVRAYYEDGYMKLITSEEAMCVYGIDSITECNYPFEDGVEIQSYEEVDHFVEWNTEEDLYIKCKDAYDIQPIPQNTCSMVVRASEYYEAEED